MNQLRIVMLAPFGIRPKGTLLARMLPLAQALARRGYRVAIVAPPVQNPQDAGRRDMYGDVLVIHSDTPTWPGPLGVAQQVSMLVRLALAERPDIVHLFKPKGYSGLAARVLRICRPAIPLVVDTDDWEGWGGWNELLPYPLPAKMLFAWQERDLPRRAAAATVVSRTLQTQVWGNGVPADRVFYIPNGADVGTQAVPEHRTREHAQTLLLYTRFWEFDLREMVLALLGIVSQRPDARLMVVGRGERGEEQALLRMSERAGVRSAIEYCGWVEPAALPALLEQADLALVPMQDTLINRARGLAKLLELMLAGLPIVASRVGQTAEYIEDGRSGLLVDPADPAALARAALALLADRVLRERLGKAAQQRAVTVFHWDVLASTAEQAYMAAVRGR